MGTVQQHAPSTAEHAAEALAETTANGQSVRIVGGATKLGWGYPTPPADVELHTSGLDRILEHNAGDLTAALQAGVPLAVAQRAFAEHDQMLALDPPLGTDSAATIGGIVATGDCGPLRHRYGAPRDLIVGVTVALSDGTVAQAGGRVIKNVAGYDLAKLFAGSFGTLGLIVSVNLRLHPRGPRPVTALGACTDPAVLAAAARGLARAPLEFEALDVAWGSGSGGLLARCTGRESARRAARAGRLMRDLGLDGIETSDDDEALWQQQRSRQRSTEQALVRVATAPTGLAGVLHAADACGGTVVGRAALGSMFIELDPGAVTRLREELAPGTTAILLDAPEGVRAELEPWGPAERGSIDLMRRIKHRFDPAGTCNRGLFVDRI